MSRLQHAVRGNDFKNYEQFARSINDQAYKEIGRYLEQELTNLAHYEVEFNAALLEEHLPYSYRPKLPDDPACEAYACETSQSFVATSVTL